MADPSVQQDLSHVKLEQLATQGKLGSIKAIEIQEVVKSLSADDQRKFVTTLANNTKQLQNLTGSQLAAILDNLKDLDSMNTFLSSISPETIKTIPPESVAKALRDMWKGEPADQKAAAALVQKFPKEYIASLTNTGITEARMACAPAIANLSKDHAIHCEASKTMVEEFRNRLNPPKSTTQQLTPEQQQKLAEQGEKKQHQLKGLVGTPNPSLGLTRPDPTMGSDGN